MARNVVNYDPSGLARIIARTRTISGKGMEQVEQRAMSTLSRRLPVQAAKLAADEILHAPRTLIRKAVNAKVSGPAGSKVVTLTGDSKRIPLSEFPGAAYAGPSAAGATVRIYKDEGARTYDRTFAIKGRGVAGGIYQRAPLTSGSSQLHDRLPLVYRKGPSVARSITEKKHGDIIPQLLELGTDILRAEITRLLRSTD